MQFTFDGDKSLLRGRGRKSNSGDQSNIPLDITSEGGGIGVWANNDSDTADFFVDGAVDGGAGGGEGGGPSRLPALVPYWLHAGRPPGEKKEARFGLGSRARAWRPWGRI